MRSMFKRSDTTPLVMKREPAQIIPLHSHQQQPTREPSTMEKVRNVLLLFILANQVVLSYQFFDVKEGKSQRMHETQIESMEERFSKISVVLRFLLENAKSPKPVTDSTKSEETPSTPVLQTDLPVARVTAPRLNLRVGPGLNHAPLMTVSAGTLLVVEDASGPTWLRVVAPNGARAFALKGELNLSSVMP